MKIAGLRNIIALNFLIILIWYSGCSRQITTGEKLNLKIVSSKINLWINLMPGIGSSQHELHLNGKISIKNLSGVAIENLILRNIRVAQNRLSLDIEPKKLISSNFPKSLLPYGENTFSLNGIKRMSGNIIDYDSTVTLILNFSSDGISLSDSIRHQFIQKVY
ncbi:MAG: hypothetical protein ACYDA4_14630 [Ignavibacteriaceae bacterium]